MLIVRNITAIMILFAMFSANSVFAGNNYTFQQPQYQTQNNYGHNGNYVQYPQNNTLQGSVIMVPAGTQIKSTLTMPISSESAVAGQTGTVALGEDFYYNNKLIAPAGSTVYGTVIEASKAKHGSMNGKLCVRFNQICTPHGSNIQISAVIKTDDNSGVLVGGTKMDVTKEYAKDFMAGSAAGALSGVVFGALAGGNIGRGAALGTAVGAGSGLAKSVWDKGNNVDIPAGASIDIVLTQPVTASSYSYDNSYGMEN